MKYVKIISGQIVKSNANVGEFIEERLLVALVSKGSVLANAKM